MSNQPSKRLPTEEIQTLLAQATQGEMVAYTDAERPGIDGWDGHAILFYGTEDDDAGVYGDTEEERAATARLFAATRPLAEEVVESRSILASVTHEIQLASTTLGSHSQPAISTFMLHGWLKRLRDALAPVIATTVPSPPIERGRDEFTPDTCSKCHGAVFGDRCLNCAGAAP